jgi:hypothetical protein
MFFTFFDQKNGFFLKDVLEEKNLVLTLPSQLAHGVTGNTSVFGTEESRFEP